MPTTITLCVRLSVLPSSSSLCNPLRPLPPIAPFLLIMAALFHLRHPYTTSTDIDRRLMPPPPKPKCHFKRLSRELLFRILRYLCDDVESLLHAARVCQRWSYQVGSLLYHTITMTVYDQLPPPRHTFTISALRAFLQDSTRADHRDTVRRMVVYYEAAQQRTPLSVRQIALGEFDSAHEEPSSPVHNRSDAEFRDTVAFLFGILQQWNPENKIQLNFVLSYTLARADAPPVGLDDVEDPKLITFPSIKCVSCLTFDYKDEEAVFQPIWEATPFHIAQSCEGLTTLIVDTDAFRWYGRQVSLEKRRDGIGESLGSIPNTLKTLSVRAVGASNPKVLDSININRDLFSYRILSLSTQLRALELYNVTLPLDFWCSLDESNRPNRVSPIWPHLRRVISVDNCLVEGSGAGGLYNSASHRKLFFSQLTRLVTSLGYAVKHMPQLDLLKCAISSVPAPIVQFMVVRSNKGKAKATLSCNCPIPHHWAPQHCMVAAWGVPLAYAFHKNKAPGTATRKVRVTYDPWPPRP
ncbi:hypothetical protein BDW74DRAFT_88000 [Aspergillus multicolor]|uniref:F-box protein n=1 Tax=Aspergillus multicolor TaxID=41759 RepID=UPI003CCCA13F